MEITTNLAWDGALRNERLFEAVHGVIEHCERSHATTIDTAKYFVDLNSYAPPISVPRKPLDREWAANPQLASYKRRIAAHELFVLPVRGFHCLPDGKQDDELLRLNVTIKVESRTPSSPLRSSLRSGNMPTLSPRSMGRWRRLRRTSLGLSSSGRCCSRTRLLAGRRIGRWIGRGW